MDPEPNGVLDTSATYLASALLLMTPPALRRLQNPDRGSTTTEVWRSRAGRRFRTIASTLGALYCRDEIPVRQEKPG